MLLKPGMQKTTVFAMTLRPGDTKTTVFTMRLKPGMQKTIAFTIILEPGMQQRSSKWKQKVHNQKREEVKNSKNPLLKSGGLKM